MHVRFCAFFCTEILVTAYDNASRVGMHGKSGIIGEDSHHSFVHADPHRISSKYYFPAQHWVGFSSADQSIQGTKDECSQCYYTQYYPQTRNGNNSNLYPLCIEECLDDVIFVATVNSTSKTLIIGILSNSKSRRRSRKHSTKKCIESPNPKRC